MELGILVGGSPLQISETSGQLGRKFLRQIWKPGNGGTRHSARAAGRSRTALSTWFPFVLGKAPSNLGGSGREGTWIAQGGMGITVTELGLATGETYRAVDRAGLPAHTANAKPFRGGGFAAAQCTGAEQGVPS